MKQFSKQFYSTLLNNHILNISERRCGKEEDPTKNPACIYATRLQNYTIIQATSDFYNFQVISSILLFLFLLVNPFVKISSLILFSYANVKSKK